MNFDVNFIRDKKGGIEKKCDKCGHKWWISKNPEKETKEAETCFQCIINDAWMEYAEAYCSYCVYDDPTSNCTGCSGPEEEDYYDYYYQD